MRILLFTWPARLQRFPDVLSELTGSGHEIVVAVPRNRPSTLSRVLAEMRGLSVVTYDDAPDPDAARTKTLLRMTHDYVWQLEPEARGAEFNRRRSLDFLVRELTRGDRGADPAWPDPVVELPPDEVASLRATLRALEEKLPAEPHLVELIGRVAPDVVLVTPLVLAGSRQPEVVKAARAAGVRSGFLVFSWDNLTNKGLIHVRPDRVFVWNEVQKREAVELHGIPAENVVVTGASRWDAFFDLRPSVERDAFLSGHGLDPGKPLVLYLGSTSAVAPDETLVIERWLHALHSREAVREVNVLVRPHPRETVMWSGWAPDHGRVALDRHPRPADQALYDQLAHADAVVGLNTSAQIEAAILGKPVLTFAAGELAPGQAGSVHFFYLLDGSGGSVGYAATLADHTAQLERILVGDFDQDAIAGFVRSFVRPHGLEQPVAPILAEAILELGR